VSIRVLKKWCLETAREAEGTIRIVPGYCWSRAPDLPRLGFPPIPRRPRVCHESLRTVARDKRGCRETPNVLSEQARRAVGVDTGRYSSRHLHLSQHARERQPGVRKDLQQWHLHRTQSQRDAAPEVPGWTLVSLVEQSASPPNTARTEATPWVRNPRVVAQVQRRSEGFQGRKRSTPSSERSRALICSPKANPVRAPFAPITRWQGTMRQMGFVALARPTARAELCNSRPNAP
jgi:hypothetical protein